ncbi:MAG: lysylphosphatidylglycerol synthase transmembrane domain-containing protein [bacterium]
MTATTARRIGWIAGIAVLGASLVAALNHIHIEQVIDELRAVRTLWIAAALACYVAILPLWAAQWRILAPSSERNSFTKMLGVVVMTCSTLHTTAFLVGEATGVVLLVTQIGLTRSAALSVTAMDQLLVGIAKLTVLATGALTLTLPAWMLAGVTALGAGVAALLAGCLFAAWNHEWVATRSARVLPTRMAESLGRMGIALAPLRSPSRGGGALLLAFAKKFVEVLAILSVQRAFGVSLPLASGVLVLAALNLATLLPLVPGNLGIFEGAVVFVYTQLGISAEQAAGIALVQHACYFVALGLPGYAWLALSRSARTALAAS